MASLIQAGLVRLLGGVFETADQRIAAMISGLASATTAQLTSTTC